MNKSLISLWVALAIGAAACGSGDPSGPGAVTTSSMTSSPTTAQAATTTTSPSALAPTTTVAAEDGFPVVVGGGNGDVVIPKRPEAIVSLSPAATEVLFAIGAGGQVKAVDSLSDYPAEAPTTQLSAFEPNVEAIAELNPDLVVLFFDPGDVVGALEALDIPTLLQFTAVTLDEVYSQTADLGVATGNIEGAAAVVSEMRSSIDTVVASVAEVDEAVTYYHELDDTYYSITTSTFIGEVYLLLGMASIGDAADDLNFGYPQLSAEFILEADPDVILLADTLCCGQTAATVGGRPGWDQLSAVAKGAIVELDDSVASRPGPRIVDLLEDVAAALLALSAPA